MKLFAGLAICCALLTTAGWAQSPVTITLGPRVAGPAIPEDFIGMSFGMKALLPSGSGGHFFAATNRPLVMLFQNLGIKHLRLGGTTVEWPPTLGIPGKGDIDSLFAFVHAAGVNKVIYSFPLLESAPELHYAATNAAIAKYIWQHYQPLLDCFAIGNEPDRKKIYARDIVITNCVSYLRKWEQFASAITSAIPAAAFAGPDAGSGNIYWTTRFAQAEKTSGCIRIITEHFYVGGAGRGVAARQGLQALLSPAWIAANQRLYDKMAAPVLANGLPYRFTEANDHYSGGVPGASDTFAGALWALDFLHWWAAHHASGVDFHNTQWVVNDVITLDSHRALVINPKGYGIKAFELGARGSVEPLTMRNPDELNLTAYAVGNGSEVNVTIINKENGARPRDAEVTFVPRGRSLNKAAAIYLSAPNGDAAAIRGVTLGGDAITNGAPWHGQWTSLDMTNDRCTVTVRAASATIVKFSSQ